MPYTPDDLVRDLRALRARELSDREMIAEVAPLAERLAEDTGWVKPEFYEVDENQGIGITVLNEEPDNTLLVETIVWAPGKGVLPHDHQTWGVVLGLDGVERNIIWKRQDDGGKEGFADLAVHHENDVGAGQTIGFMPNDIHSVRNLGDAPTLSLHIYGKSLGHVSRSEFDPDAKVQRPCPIRAKRPAA